MLRKVCTTFSRVSTKRNGLFLASITALAGVIEVIRLSASFAKRVWFTDRFILALAVAIFVILAGLVVAWIKADKDQSEKLKNFAEVGAICVGGIVGATFWLGPQSRNYFAPAHMTLTTSYNAVEHEGGCLVTVELTMKNESNRTLTVAGVYQIANALHFSAPVQYSGMVLGPSDLAAAPTARDVNARYERRVLAPNETESILRATNYDATERKSYHFGRLLTRIPFRRGMLPSGEVCGLSDNDVGFRILGSKECISLGNTVTEEGGKLTAMAVIDIQKCVVVQKTH